jgi:type II secretory pathway component PulL
MENIYKTLFPETKKVINPLIQIKEKLKKNDNSLKIPISGISIIKILEEITILFPENINVEVEELMVSGKNVSLTGVVDNLKNLDRIKDNLKNSKIFKNFDVTSVSFTKENRVSFNLILRMED